MEEGKGKRECLKKDQISPIAACAQGEKVGFGFFFGLFVLGGGWLIGESQWSQGRVMMKEVEKKLTECAVDGRRLHDHFCENVLPSQRLEA